MNTVQPIRDTTKIKAMRQELAKTGSRNELLFLIGINTGLRISDILPLRVEDVRGRDFYELKEKKTGKKKRIRLTEIRAEIDRYTDGMQPEAYLFASRQGDSHITAVQAYRVLTAAAERVGLEEIGTHTMRKTFGYHMYQRTKDVALLQELFNHSAPSITLRYIGISQDNIDQATAGFRLG